MLTNKYCHQFTLYANKIKVILLSYVSLCIAPIPISGFREPMMRSFRHARSPETPLLSMRLALDQQPLELAVVTEYINKSHCYVRVVVSWLKMLDLLSYPGNFMSPAIYICESVWQVLFTSDTNFHTCFVALMSIVKCANVQTFHSEI